MQMIRKYTFVSIIFVLIWGSVYAQYPILADRPGISFGTNTVNPGFFQFEGGWQFNRCCEGFYDFTYPNFNFRTGITDRLELNLFWSGIANQHIKEVDQVTHLTQDFSAGVKYSLCEKERYSASAFGAMSLPIGEKGASSGHLDPVAALVADYIIGERMATFATFLFSSGIINHERILNFFPALGLAYSLQSNLALFLEYYGRARTGGAKMQHNLDFGAGYLLSNDLQLDASFGINLSHPEAFFLSIGAAFRLKLWESGGNPEN